MAGCFREGKRRRWSRLDEFQRDLRVQTIELEMEGARVIKSDGPEQAWRCPFTRDGEAPGRKGVGREGRLLMVTSMGFHVLNDDKDNIG